LARDETDGPQRTELEQRFAGLNANFIGYLKGADLAAAYASADAFVYASVALGSHIAPRWGSRWLRTLALRNNIRFAAPTVSISGREGM
jgi:glycosyltransferase involved in cell wall biosynthesis